MPSQNAFAAYRLGVRLAQLAGFPERSKSAGIDAVKATLWEDLLLVAEGLRHIEGAFGIVAESIRASQDLLQAFRFSPNSAEREATFETLRTTAGHWKTNLMNVGNQGGGPGELPIWFELGIEIINGADDYSEGIPSLLQPGEPRQVLVFENPRPHRWDLQNRERFDELLSRLGIGLGDVFVPPDVNNRIDVFDELSESLSWAWCQIENGVRSLAVHLAPPVWDGDKRTLTVRGEVVLRFQNAAAKQMQIIQAFVDANWEPTADCPFGKAELRGQTLRDLNKSIDPKSIFFGGTGDGQLRWSYTALRGSE